MTIGVIGLGYVGLPLAVAFAEAGEHVVAVDIDERKIAAIDAGESYIEDITSERLQAVLDPIEADLALRSAGPRRRGVICVPTPLTANREPDLEPLLARRPRALGHVVQQGQLVVLESTTYPGTTREHLVPLLEQESDLRGRRRPQRRVLARAGRSRAHRLHDAQHAQGRRRHHRPRAPSGRAELYGRICDDDRARLHPRGGRDDQAAGEHLPLGQHRAGQRAVDPRPTAWASTSGRSSTPPRPSRTGSCASSPAPAWAATACPSIRSISPGGRASSTCRPSSSSSPARSTSRCPTTAWSGSSRRSTTWPSRSRAHGSRSSASATRAASATSVSRRRCGSWRCSASAGRCSPTTTPTFPRCPSSGCAAPSSTSRARGRRGRAGHRAPRHRLRRGPARLVAAGRPARHHPRQPRRDDRPAVGPLARSRRPLRRRHRTIDRRSGRVAQRESARFTRERSVVRNHPCP